MIHTGMEMASIRPQVQYLFEEFLIRDLSLLVLSYLRDKAVCACRWGVSGIEQGELGGPYDITLSSPGEITLIDRSTLFNLEYHIPKRVISRRDFPKCVRLHRNECKYLPGVTLRSSGELIVKTMVNHRIDIQGFIPKEEILTFLIDKQVRYVYAFNVALLPSGEIVIEDVSKHRINVFIPEGEFLSMLETKRRDRVFDTSDVTLLPSGKIIAVSEYYVRFFDMALD